MEETQKRIEDIEKEIRETPYHKGTEHHIGLLRARLAKLKDQILTPKGGKGGGGGFAIKKHGDATVVLVGFPSVGKSTLLNKLTNAKSKTAEYSFTTVTVIPGMLDYKKAKIQILDVPGLIEGASSGKGRGREVLSVVRSADMLLILAAAGHNQDFQKITDELYLNGVRLNQEPPKVQVIKTGQGGLAINSSVKQELKKETIEAICREFRLTNTQVNLQEKLTIERLVDALATNRIFVSALFVITKTDLQKRYHVLKQDNNNLSPVFVSAKENTGIDELKEQIWDTLGFVRVYLRDPFASTDYDKPLIMRQGEILRSVAQKIGPEFAEGKKYVKIWGNGAKFPAQEVSLSTKVVDGMEVSFS